jgi:branched-subunit amino acid transport protein
MEIPGEGGERMTQVWMQILVMAAVTFAVRAVPLTILRKPITNSFVRSFLYYVPYVTLAVMTFPAILSDAGSPAAGLIAFAVGILLAFRGAGLFATSVCCCAAVLLAQLL